jgi:4-amino-4-deoxy-L-arabinose transferase-like glycosyltransferase
LGLVLAVVALLILPPLFQDGMFMDGTMYTAVAHNLAQGKGSFWYPWFAPHFHGLPSFHENPPLGYWLTSWAFELGGSSLYAERFYLLAVLAFTLVLVVYFWRRLQPGRRESVWFPLLLWMGMPIVFWAYRHNIMENTMLPFILGAILLQYEALRQERPPYLAALGAGLLLTGAFLVKGFTGLYPLVLPVLHWLFYRRPSKVRTLWFLLLTTATLLGSLALLWWHPHTHQSMSYYLLDRTLHRIQEVPTVSNRAFILGVLAQQLVLPALLAGAVWAFGQRKWSPDWKKFGFLGTLALAGILPLMLTAVQRPFYLQTTTPLLALAVASLVGPFLPRWQQVLAGSQRKRRIVRTLAPVVATLALGLTLQKAGTPKRNAQLVHDAHLLARHLPAGTHLEAPKELAQHWRAKAYLVRYGNLHLLRAKNAGDTPYQIRRKGAPAPPGSAPVDYSLRFFELYKKARP